MIKFVNRVIINPPPFSDNRGNIVNKPPLMLTEIDPIIIDNPTTKSVVAQVLGIPSIIPIWSGEDYETKGDWTRKEVEDKLLEILGDNPAVTLRTFFPKTLEESPNHSGTVLAKMIKSVGIFMTDSCSCRKHALEMNEKGNDWCEQNIDTIVGWLREEATKRKLPFVDAIGKLMVNRAIKKSRKLLANQPVPENDEDLDKE
jgi:hypothetical protein